MAPQNGYIDRVIPAANRLINEASPYLLQHAHNPVDWYPWGEEALRAARERDVPILLSIGYAACHWCHVMEHESFEDEATARLMNENFVCVKVDREERPDLDSVYMQAVQAMTGQGGWPMTVFLTPEGVPFYGGTYFPNEDRHGLPAFRRVLEALAEAWRTKRDEIAGQGRGLTQYIEKAAQLHESADPLTESVLRDALRGMARSFDREWGGFGGAPKFPQPMTLDFLMRMHARHEPGALDMLVLTLQKMGRGGIFDHVGGGFHRYSVDRVWLVPHFEKMLYDNGQLLRLYSRVWLLGGDPLHRGTAIATADYLLREMRHPEGGFFSSQDADSEGVEGKFYVWSYDDLVALAGKDIAEYFGAAPQGNWEGANVVWTSAATKDLPSEVVARARHALFEAREKRVRPATDDKVIASWNGMAISGLVEAGRALDRSDYVVAAAHAAEFVLSALRRPDGRLLRSWRDGRTSGPAFLDDYALMASACLDLYETTFEPRWFVEAERLARAMIELFTDSERGGFFDTGTDVEAPFIRPKDLFDNATPSGSSAAAEILLRVAALTGDPDLERAGISPIRVIAPALSQHPLGFGRALCALDLNLSHAKEVAIVGDPSAADTRALAETVWRRPLTNRVMAVGPAGSSVPPLLRDRPQRDGQATAYVCEGFACKEPVTDPGELAAQLEA
jgi:uncharacterized protein